MDRNFKRRISEKRIVRQSIKKAYYDLQNMPTVLIIKDGVGYIYLVDYSGQQEKRTLVGVIDASEYISKALA